MPGTGQIVVNQVDIQEYFKNKTQRMVVTQHFLSSTNRKGGESLRVAMKSAMKGTSKAFPSIVMLLPRWLRLVNQSPGSEGMLAIITFINSTGPCWLRCNCSMASIRCWVSCFCCSNC